MAFKNLDIESALRRLAERRIEEAMREGKFDNLPGKGKPIDLEPMPANEDARLAWWALRILRNNNFTPDEVRWRKQIDTYREELQAATTERRIRALVTVHNQLVHQINTMGTNALKAPVAPLSLEAELRKFRQREMLLLAGGSGPDDRPCASNMCRCLNPRQARFCRRCGSEIAA
jgi:hypothetical protein